MGVVYAHMHIKGIWSAIHTGGMGGWNVHGVLDILPQARCARLPKGRSAEARGAGVSLTCI